MILNQKCSEIKPNSVAAIETIFDLLSEPERAHESKTVIMISNCNMHSHCQYFPGDLNTQWRNKFKKSLIEFIVVDGLNNYGDIPCYNYNNEDKNCLYSNELKFCVDSFEKESYSSDIDQIVGHVCTTTSPTPSPTLNPTISPSKYPTSTPTTPPSKKTNR